MGAILNLSLHPEDSIHLLRKEGVKMEEASFLLFT
jgi:hypothetical protein